MKCPMTYRECETPARCIWEATQLPDYLTTDGGYACAALMMLAQLGRLEGDDDHR
jgi:hypothetical protein